MMIALLTGILMASSAQADAVNVLQLQRVNYKPEKVLQYDLHVNAATCEIRRNSPFEVYYRDKTTGRRLPDFSGNSQEYFGPRAVNVGANQAELQFEALDQIQKELEMRATLLMRSEKVDGKCVTTTEISYGNKRYELKEIFLKMKKTFGIPTGLDWVRLKGKSERGPIDDCVTGGCNG